MEHEPPMYTPASVGDNTTKAEQTRPYSDVRALGMMSNTKYRLL